MKEVYLVFCCNSRPSYEEAYADWVEGVFSTAELAAEYVKKVAANGSESSDLWVETHVIDERAVSDGCLAWCELVARRSTGEVLAAWPRMAHPGEMPPRREPFVSVEYVSRDELTISARSCEDAERFLGEEMDRRRRAGEKQEALPAEGLKPS